MGSVGFVWLHNPLGYAWSLSIERGELMIFYLWTPS